MQDGADSEEEMSYLEFLNDKFWLPIAQSKVKIKSLRKQIAAEEKVMRDRLAAIHDFFYDGEEDEFK